MIQRNHLTIQSAALALFAVVTVSCASTVKTVHGFAPINVGAHWVMLPVANYSETPQAGERVEALLETVLRKGGVTSLRRYPPLKQDDTHLILSDRQRYEESLAWAQGQRFDYGVTGSVEEWRYKGGLEGDPAVGLTLVVFELATNRVVWSASGSRTGTGADSVSGTALTLLGSLIDELNPPR